MTGEELDRAIEFLLQGQANHQVRLDELTAQVAEIGRVVQLQAETQSEFIQIVTHTMTGLAEAQSRTEEQLNKLISVVGQHISGHP
ncbi:MAG: hypothetical protein QOG71_3549 [Pyrinomonadaceae bacterium]|nr:hypothetical protein [Pyrinomonadaceae bacterium]